MTIISLIGLYGQCLIPTRTSYALSGVRELISRNTWIHWKSAKSGEHGRWLFSVRAIRRFYDYRGKPLSIHFYFAVYFKFSLLTYRNSACNRISRSNLNIFMFVKILESDSGIPILSFISILQISSKDRSLKSVEEEGFPRLFFSRSTDDSAGWTSNVIFFSASRRATSVDR